MELRRLGRSELLHLEALLALLVDLFHLAKGPRKAFRRKRIWGKVHSEKTQIRELPDLLLLDVVLRMVKKHGGHRSRTARAHLTTLRDGIHQNAITLQSGRGHILVDADLRRQELLRHSTGVPHHSSDDFLRSVGQERRPAVQALHERGQAKDGPSPTGRT
jgi:hypothetical protein